MHIVMQLSGIALLLCAIAALGVYGMFSAERVTDVGNLPPGVAYVVVGHDGEAQVSVDGFIVGVVHYNPAKHTHEFDDIYRFDVREYEWWAGAHRCTGRRVDLHLIGCWFTEAACEGVQYEPAEMDYRQVVAREAV